MQITEPKTAKKILDVPVVITITEVQELHWMYEAISAAVHLKGVEEDSPQQEFYAKAHVTLNSIAARYRDHGM